MIVEVEVDSLVQLQQVLSERPDVVLLDNMSCEELRTAVQMRDSVAANVELDASGGVTLASVPAWLHCPLRLRTTWVAPLPARMSRSISRVPRRRCSTPQRVVRRGARL